MMALAEALRQLGRGVGDPQLLADLGAMLADPQPHLEALPPSRQPVLEKVWPWWSELLSHPGRDRFWQDLSVLDRAEQVTVPALHIGGWFDIFSQGTLMLRLVVQVSMFLALPLMAFCLYWKVDLAPWYIAYVLLFALGASAHL